jgi:hypothetical protein
MMPLQSVDKELVLLCLRAIPLEVGSGFSIRREQLKDGGGKKRIPSSMQIQGMVAMTSLE